MKNFIGNAVVSALISRGVIRGGYPISLKNPSNFGSRVRTARRIGGVGMISKKNNRRNRRAAGLEINKAAGGFKSIISTGAIRHLAVNEYGRLMLTKSGAAYSYRITLRKEQHATEYSSVDLAALINESEEFNEWCQCSNQYKVYGVRISIDYSRVPQAGDTLARLLMSVRTDKANVLEPGIERNVMNLDMSMVGVKNFNFNLNTRNTNVEHLGWIDTQDYYAAVLALNLEGQDVTILKDTEPSSVLLGTVKFSFMVKCRLRDYIPGSNNKRPVLRRKKITVYQTDEGLKDQDGRKIIIEDIKREAQLNKITAAPESEEEEESEYDDEDEQIEAFK